MIDDEDWAAVAHALNTRMRQQRIGQQALSADSGVSVATLRHLQRGTSGRRTQDATLAAVSRALGWPDGHLLAVLVGDRRAEVATAAADPATIYDALRAIESQLARMNDRLDSVEQAVLGARAQRC